MEFDLINPEILLFSDSNQFRQTDGNNADTLVGSVVPGYAEGVGTKARFWSLTGFTQLNKTSILAADCLNNCL